MTHPAHRQPIFWGGVLIVLGTVLLLHKLELLPFSWWVLIWGGVAAAALFMIVRRFREHGEGVFWWVLVFCFALYKLVGTANWLYLPSWYGLPLMLIAVGIAFATTVALRPRDWHLVVPAALFLFVGGGILMAEMGTLEDEVVRSAIRSYWPFALIAFGAALLLNWRDKKPTAS